MKKLIISSVLGVALAASTAFGQGYISFGAATKGSVWNDTGSSFVSSSTAPVTDSGFDATFLWSATSSTSPMYLASTPTNNSTSVSASQAWSDIEGASSSGWTVATTGGASVIGTPANNLGSFSYNSAGSFGLDGTTGSGEVINLYVIGWETDGGLYNSLAAAEAGGAAIGWSSVFSYTLAAAPPQGTATETVVPHFGIGPVPEPTTLALAGLGGLSMLFLRRKKA